MTSLATPENLQGLSLEDVPEATALLWLASASATIRTYCGWQIDEATETLTVEGTPYPTLVLPTLHVTAVTAVTVDGVALDAGSWEWSPDGRLRRPQGWGTSLAGVQVELTHGWAEVPADVVAVTCSIALRGWLNPASNAGESLAGASDSYETGLAPLERLILDRYRLEPRP